MNLIRDMSSGITLLKLPPYPLGDHLYMNLIRDISSGITLLKLPPYPLGDHLYIYDNKLSVLIPT